MDEFDHQSAAVVGSNDDLLTEILIRLPVTSIRRFKSVCKHWRLLLTRRYFTYRYDNNNLSESLGYFARIVLTQIGIADDIYVQFDVENRKSTPFRSLAFYFSYYLNRSDVRIEQSCNGLLLCSAPYNGALEYAVFNPTIEQWAVIPLGPKNIRSIALAFHQKHCVHYKLVCIHALKPDDEKMFQVQVYSAETRKWNICIESFSAPEPIFHDPVYWNGAVYWPPYYPDRNYFYFKLDVEQLQAMPVPEGLVSDDKLMYFGESRDHLHLILHKHHEANILILNVYEMLMDHSGWFVKYKVQLDDLLTAFPNMVHQYGYNFDVVDVVRGKEEQHVFLVLLSRGKMIRYNVHDKSFMELYSKRLCFVLASSFHRYIEALSSF